MRVSDTSQRLGELMQKRNLKQVDILEMSKPYQEKYNINMGKSALSQYVSGKSSPDQHKIFLLAKTLKVSEPWLMGYDVNNQLPADNLEEVSVVTNIPILGKIACGEPITAEENVIDYRPVYSDRLPSGNLFYLQAQGDSMIPLIPDKSFVLVREQEDVENGEIAAVLVNGDEEATLKKVRKLGDSILLEAINDEYQPYLVNKENPARIIGKAVKVEFDL